MCGVATSYCAFHLGDYKKALDTYEEMARGDNAPADVHLCESACYFYLQVQLARARMPTQRAHGTPAPP